MCYLCLFFFFNDTATTEIYTLSLHDALPIFDRELSLSANSIARDAGMLAYISVNGARSEEHTSELQSLTNLVCRLLLEKKKKHTKNSTHEQAIRKLTERTCTTVPIRPHHTTA